MSNNREMILKFFDEIGFGEHLDGVKETGEKAEAVIYFAEILTDKHMTLLVEKKPARMRFSLPTINRLKVEVV